MAPIELTATYMCIEKAPLECFSSHVCFVTSINAEVLFRNHDWSVGCSTTDTHNDLVQICSDSSSWVVLWKLVLNESENPQNCALKLKNWKSNTYKKKSNPFVYRTVRDITRLSDSLVTNVFGEKKRWKETRARP